MTATEIERDCTCWVNTICLEHVERGVAGGFTQAGHGSDRGLRKLRRGDPVAFYSPRYELSSSRTLQRFTAFGIVSDDEPYRVQVSEGFRPWRVRVDFQSVQQADLRPMVNDLSFIRDPQHWGMPFRRGLFTIPAGDMAKIAEAMKVIRP